MTEDDFKNWLGIAAATVIIGGTVILLWVLFVVAITHAWSWIA